MRTESREQHRSEGLRECFRTALMCELMLLNEKQSVPKEIRPTLERVYELIAEGASTESVKQSLGVLLESVREEEIWAHR